MGDWHTALPHDASARHRASCRSERLGLLVVRTVAEPPVRKGEASALEKKTDEAVAQSVADGLSHYQNYYSKKLFNYYFSSIVDVDAGL